MRCTGEAWPAAKRKRFFWSKANRAGRQFTTEHVWTWQIYQHVVDMGAYELSMIYTFNLADKLDGQPLQFMVKDRCGVGPVCGLLCRSLWCTKCAWLHHQRKWLARSAVAAALRTGGEASKSRPGHSVPCKPLKDCWGNKCLGALERGVHARHCSKNFKECCVPSVVQGERAVPGQLPCMAQEPAARCAEGTIMTIQRSTPTGQ